MSVSTIRILAILCCIPGLACAQHGQHSGPVMNFHRIDDSLASGGHFTDGGLGKIQAQGVELIIDLRPEPPEGQRKRVQAAGIEWAHVPMEWKAPKAEDFEKFAQVLKANPDAHILIQCAANYRASSMTFLHRVIHLGEPPEQAREALLSVWEPNETWQAYIDKILAAHGH